MKTLLQVVELWVPDAEGQLLELQDGLYGGAKAFERLSRSMCFGRGEGLPGRVWEEGHPILLKDLQAGYFRRAAAARNAGLTAAVALPVFAADLLKAVVVIFCGEGEGEAGAIELWHNDPRVTTDMTLVDGYYGAKASSAEGLAAASRDTFLPRGAGLPGLAWQRQASVFMDDLTDPSKFVRFEEAAATGMRRGLAIPCPLRTRQNFAVTILSSAALPFARQVESWMPTASGLALRREFGFSEDGGRLPSLDIALGDAVAPGASEATVLDAFRSASPRLLKGASSTHGGSGLLALPIDGDGSVAEVLAVYI
jgi:hypothetical protein